MISPEQPHAISVVYFGMADGCLLSRLAIAASPCLPVMRGRPFQILAAGHRNCALASFEEKSPATKGIAMEPSEDRAMRALGRTLRMWSLIRMLPVRRLLPLQSPLLKLFATQADLTEDQLVKLGLKHLHRMHGLNRTRDKKPRKIADVAVDDGPKR